MTSGPRVVAVVSPKGGVGKTTVVANLAAALADRGRSVAVVDLDPQNAVRLHLQMALDDEHGLALQALRDEPLADICYESSQGLAVLPYGGVSEAERQQFEKLLAEQPNWLQTELAALRLPEHTLILLDTPPGASVYMQQALSAAQFALLVLLPDAASFVTIGNMERWLDEYSRPRSDFLGAFYLVNRMNNARPLCRDVLQALQRELGGRLVPDNLHFDAAVEEALASQLPVSRYAPESVAARDFGVVANWLSERI
jgi:cellulose synthase operon protein YhjQ